MSNDIVTKDCSEELVLTYRKDPVIAARDLLGIELAVPQRLALRAMWESDNVVLLISRGGGKTFIDALVGVLRALLFPGERVGLISSSFRQCFFSDMDCLPIFTSKGMVSSPEEFFSMVVPGDTRINSIVEHNTILNKWKTEGDGFIVDLFGGFSIGGLGRHEILTISKDGELKYKNLDNLEIGDWAAIKSGNGLFGCDDDIYFEYPGNRKIKRFKVPDKMTPDLAYWIGLVTGDGCISHYKKQNNKRNKIIFINSDPDLLRSCSDFSLSNFNMKAEIKKPNNNKATILDFISVFLAEFMGSLGVSDKLSHEKEIPSSIRKASRLNVSAFLSGMFDTDGSFSLTKNKGAIVDLSTSSRRMASQVQCFLLQFGIMSSITVSVKSGKRFLLGRKKLSDIKTGYKVRITSREMMSIFQSEIGFRCIRKKKALEEYLSGDFKDRSSIHHLIPNIHIPLLKLLKEMRKKTRYGMIYEQFIIRHTSNNCRHCRPISHGRLVKVLELAYKLVPGIDELRPIEHIVNSGIHFRKVVKKTPHSGDAIDIEVEKEHCYIAGGIVNHNSKFVFAEVEKIYDMSPILRENCFKKPVRGTDMCYLHFNPCEDRPPSVIEAIPIGDGGKIRGARYYTVLCDEAAQVPKDILNIVIRGMMATSKNPMESVKHMAEQRRLMEMGLIDKVDKLHSNKLILSSTAYYQYNHLWERVCGYIDTVMQKKRKAEQLLASGGVPTPDMWTELRGKPLNDGQIPANIIRDAERAVIAFDHDSYPPGFMNEDSINEARKDMPMYQFNMEYKCLFPADSDGFFTRSLIDKTQLHLSFACLFEGDLKYKFFLGIDPARNGDNFTIGVVRLDQENKKIDLVRMKSYSKKTYPDMHLEIRSTIKEYNICELGMDSGGGGTAIRDLLANDDNKPQGEPLILQRNFEEHASKKGRRILNLVEFSDYSWLHDANHDLLLGMQDGTFRMPVEKSCIPGCHDPETTADDLAYEEIEKTIDEFQNIVVKFTQNGRMHWDTPQKRQRKDRYTAVLIAYSQALSYLENLQKPQQLASGYWKR